MIVYICKYNIITSSSSLADIFLMGLVLLGCLACVGGWAVLEISLHFFWMQHCFRLPGPPNLGLSLQLEQIPQSSRIQPSHDPHRFLFTPIAKTMYICYVVWRDNEYVPILVVVCFELLCIVVCLELFCVAMPSYNIVWDHSGETIITHMIILWCTFCSELMGLGSSWKC